MGSLHGNVLGNGENLAVSHANIKAVSLFRYSNLFWSCSFAYLCSRLYLTFFTPRARHLSSLQAFPRAVYCPDKLFQGQAREKIGQARKRVYLKQGLGSKPHQRFQHQRQRERERKRARGVSHTERNRYTDTDKSRDRWKKRQRQAWSDSSPISRF